MRWIIISQFLWLSLTDVTIAQTTRATITAPITSCVFTPDGKSLLAAHLNEIQVLSVPDGKLHQTVMLDGQRATSLALSESGELLAVAGGVPGVSGRVLLLDERSQRVVARAEGFADLTTSVAFDPRGKTLAAASADGTVQLFSISRSPVRLEPAALLKGHAGPVLSTIFSHDGQSVITASADRSIKVWNTRTGALQRTLSNHTDIVNCLAPQASPSKQEPAAFICASGSDDHTVRVWQPEVGRMVRIIRQHDGAILALCYSPDGSALYSAGTEGIVRVIDAQSDTIQRQWKASDDWIYALAISRDGKHLAISDWSGIVKIWNLEGIGNR